MAAGLLSDRYDDDLRRWWRRYLPGYGFRWGKAQLWQESRYKKTAVSPAGAKGIAQFMPATWGEVTEKIGEGGVSPFVARVAIQAQAYYMAELRAYWRTERPEIERMYLMLASYNAGAGNITKAQRLCNGALLWRDIAPCLKRLPIHYREPIDYVDRIVVWREALLIHGG